MAAAAEAACARVSPVSAGADVYRPIPNHQPPTATSRASTTIDAATACRPRFVAVSCRYQPARPPVRTARRRPGRALGRTAAAARDGSRAHDGRAAGSAVVGGSMLATGTVGWANVWVAAVPTVMSSRAACTSASSAPASVGRPPGSRRVARATRSSSTAGSPATNFDGGGTSWSTCRQATSTGLSPS